MPEGKTKKITTEEDLILFGEKLGKNLRAPKVIELIGDVGAGKTTLTKGIARGLGVKEEITSPTFTISKRYFYEIDHDEKNNSVEQKSPSTLVHYDFYRLDDPGIMIDDFEENLQDKNTIIIIEWGDSIQDFLPEENHLKFEIKINDDGTREIFELDDENIFSKIADKKSGKTDEKSANKIKENLK